MIWWILSAAAAVALLAHWNSRNAVWGTATFGALVGAVIAAIKPGFDWGTVGKAFVIGTFIGLAFEWLPRIVPRPSNRVSGLKTGEEQIEYDSIRHHFTEGDIEELFGTINSHNTASFIDKENARHGLFKLLGEDRLRIPTDSEIASLSLFFSEEFIGVLLEKKAD